MLNKEKIMDIRKEAAKAAHEATGYIPGCFEPKALDESSIDIIETIRDVIREKELIYRENTELCIICDMALLYLENYEKERKEN